MMDRRALFFIGAAVLCAVLIAPTEAHLRWVPISMAIAYAVLAAWSYLDFRQRRRSDPHGPNGAPDEGHGQPNRPVT
jgi:hypothetical protein